MTAIASSVVPVVIGWILLSLSLAGAWILAPVLVAQRRIALGASLALLVGGLLAWIDPSILYPLICDSWFIWNCF